MFSLKAHTASAHIPADYAERVEPEVKQLSDSAPVRVTLYDTSSKAMSLMSTMTVAKERASVMGQRLWLAKVPEEYPRETRSFVVRIEASRRGLSRRRPALAS